jgi:hypothetical protein
LKKEEKMVMLKATTSQKLMIVCLCCIMSGDMLNLLLLRIGDHNPGQGTHEHCLWDGWAPSVNIDD